MTQSKYKCVKCGNGISSSSHPLIGVCRKGGGHDWAIVDGVDRRYKCIKCGDGQSGNSPPLVGQCRKGGGHDWRS
jgi:DNA-directed RNA polymerase subunit RPC12/RpoP